MKRFILLLSIFIAINTFSQIKAQSLDTKYDNYRNNLVNYYMLGVGDIDGYSIAASERQTESHRIKWADATISLGHYIGVLATEYHILSAEKQNTQQTIKELYYAISALYRLDYRAETYYIGEDSIKGVAKLNGFFIRDDIGSLSDKEYHRLNNNSKLTSVNRFESDLMDYDKALGFSINNEMSKDQVIFLLMGLQLVDKYIPEEISYYKGGERIAINYSPNISSIKLAAKHISILMLEYISSNKNLLGWYIKNPITNKKVKRGFNAFHFQAKAYNKIYERYTDGNNIYGRCNRLTSAIENGLLRISIGTITKKGQGHMVLTLAAISNQFGKKTQSKIFKYSFKKYSTNANYEWESLLHAVLFSVKNDSLNAKKVWFENFLSDAPMNGPYNFKNGDKTSYDWSVSRRTTQPENRGDKYTGYKATFNGLDYMLIYNLYRIYYLQ